MSYQQSPYARPGAPRTTSSNYAAAQAIYAAKKHSSSPSFDANLPFRTLNSTALAKDDDDKILSCGEGRRVVGDPSAGAGWTPRYVQVQSFSEQDMKREFQMARLAEGTGAGFSQK